MLSLIKSNARPEAAVAPYCSLLFILSIMSILFILFILFIHMITRNCHGNTIGPKITANAMKTPKGASAAILAIQTPQ